MEPTILYEGAVSVSGPLSKMRRDELRKYSLDNNNPLKYPTLKWFE
jgi:hypothetical protein